MWMSIPVPESPDSTPLIEVDSSREEIVSVKSSEVKVHEVVESAMPTPVYNMAAGDSDHGAGYEDSDLSIQILEAEEEEAQARAQAAATRLRLLRAREAEMSTRSQVSSRPSSSRPSTETHEANMREILDEIGVPLHQPVLPIAMNGGGHQPYMPRRLGQVREREFVGHGIMPGQATSSADSSIADDRDRKIQQLQKQLSELRTGSEGS